MYNCFLIRLRVEEQNETELFSNQLLIFVNRMFGVFSMFILQLSDIYCFYQAFFLMFKSKVKLQFSLCKIYKWYSHLLIILYSIWLSSWLMTQCMKTKNNNMLHILKIEPTYLINMAFKLLCLFHSYLSQSLYPFYVSFIITLF